MWKRGKFILVAGGVIVVTVAAICVGTWTRPAGPDELDSKIEQNGLFAFREGKPEIDNGTDVIFLPDRRVHVIKYGNAVHDYEGTFAINCRGEITFTLRDRFGDSYVLREMALLRDMSSLSLAEPHATIKWRAWPVSAKETEWIRERLRTWTPVATEPSL